MLYHKLSSMKPIDLFVSPDRVRQAIAEGCTPSAHDEETFHLLLGILELSTDVPLCIEAASALYRAWKHQKLENPQRGAENACTVIGALWNAAERASRLQQPHVDLYQSVADVIRSADENSFSVKNATAAHLNFMEEGLHSPRSALHGAFAVCCLRVMCTSCDHVLGTHFTDSIEEQNIPDTDNVQGIQFGESLRSVAKAFLERVAKHG